MGHFRASKTLTFKTRLSANLCCENEFYLTEHKNHFQINGFALSLALKQRLRQLRKGLLYVRQQALNVPVIHELLPKSHLESR